MMTIGNVRACVRFLVFAAFLGSSIVALGQFSSNIQGTVNDQNGAAIPGATILLTNMDTGAGRTVISGPYGDYHFISLGSGRYMVKAAAKGFSESTVTIQLTTAQTLEVPIKMLVGTANQTVEVTTEAPNLDTAETRSEDTIAAAQLSSLPLGERSLFPLITLAPGVQGLGSDLLSAGEGSSTANFSPQITFDLTANGRGPGANMFVLDGLDVTSNIANGALNLSPNPDSVQEVSIQANTFSAEYGRAASLQIIMTTKSGTEKYHGVLSDSFNYQRLWTGTEFVHKYAPFHSNDGDGAVGGPVPHLRGMFFFGSVESLRSLAATGNQIITFEDPQFTAFAKQNFPSTVGTGLVTNHGPTGASSNAVVATAANLFPGTCGTAAAANIPCNLPMVDSGIFNASNYRDGLQYNFRIDEQFQKDRIYGNFYKVGLTTGGPAVRTGMATSNAYSTNSFQANETHVFSSNTLNEIAFGLNRVEGNNDRTGDFTVPVVNVVGMGSSFGVGFADGDYVQHNYRWRDVLTHVVRTHTLKVGYDGWHGDDLAYFAPSYGLPTFTFTNLLNLVEDKPYSESGLAYDPLTGLPGKGQYMFAMGTSGVFAMDTWKATHRVTLTYGVRWDNYGNAYPIDGTILANFFMGSGTSFEQQVANGSMRQVHHVLNRSPQAFSPRVGAAWDVTGNGTWVIRGGAGVFHDWPALGQDENGLKGNPPGWVVPNFLTGTTTAPVFALGTSRTYPFGYTYPQFTATGLDSHGGLIGEQAGVGGVDVNLNASNTYNYTVTVARSLGPKFMASAGYAGSRSTGLTSGADGNGVQSFGTDINHFAGDLIVNNGVLTRLNHSFGSLSYSFQQSSARYNAAIFAVKGKLLKESLTIDASYTRSSGYDNAATYPTAILTSQYWGPSPDNAPNRVSMTVNYIFPSLGKSNGLLNRVMGGWELSSPTILQSGYPFTVYTSAPFEPVFNSQGKVVGTQPGSGDYNADGNNNDFPDVPSTLYNTARNRKAFLSGIFPASAFGLPAMGAEGNELSNRFVGPSYAQTDISLSKSTSITERSKFIFRGEFFNVFNHPNLNSMVSDLSSSSFGKVTSQSAPRWIQFTGRITF
jgi:hypothetical protein